MCFHNPRPTPRHLLLVPEPQVYRRATSQWWRALVLFLLGAVLTGVSAARAEAPGEPDSGRLLLHLQGITQAALHLESRANITINGMLAKVALQQTFQNTGKTASSAGTCPRP